MLLLVSLNSLIDLLLTFFGFLFSLFGILAIFMLMRMWTLIFIVWFTYIVFEFLGQLLKLVLILEEDVVKQFDVFEVDIQK